MKRVGSGRTKGAGSFVVASLGALNEVLRPEASVIVSRRYAEQLQLNCQNFKATTENINAAAQQVQFGDVDFVPEADTKIEITEMDW